MGRSSKAVAERHHHELVEAAARLVRERDLGAVSVPDVMGEIGLTRGGFYKHFESKDALVAAAVGQVFREHFQRLENVAAEQGGDPAATRAAFVDFCLSEEHRDDPGSGCPASLASGIARSEPDSAPRVAYLDGLASLLALMTERVGDEDADPSEQREQFLGDLATIAGALLLARATAGDPVSDEFLAAARRRLSFAGPGA